MSEYGNIFELLNTPAAAHEGTLFHLRRKAVARLMEPLDDERRVFLGGWVKGRYNRRSRELDALERAMAGGVKPSEYARTELRWVQTMGFIPAEYWEELLAAMDRVLEQPYVINWEGRSYRSSNYGAYAERVNRLLEDFVNDVLLQMHH